MIFRNSNPYLRSSEEPKWKILSEKFGSRCFAGGWGKTNATDFALANNLKFTNVKIIDPMICAKTITGDKYLQDQANHDKIVCAEVRN